MSVRDDFLRDIEAQKAVKDLIDLFDCEAEAVVLLEVPSATGLVPLPSRLGAGLIGCTRCGDAREDALYIEVSSGRRLCSRCSRGEH